METRITEVTPLAFMARPVETFPDEPAVIHGETTWTYRELAAAAEHRLRPSDPSG